MKMKDLMLKRDNAWQVFGKREREAVYAFAEDYKAFLNASKTERECVTVMSELLARAGFRELETERVSDLRPGDKIYANVREKGLVAAVIGEQPLTDGMNIIGAHVDSPRMDLKPVPLYEDAELAFLKTHYYGGIKKYQWTTIPMAIHGVVYNRDGEKITISIGERDDDPVFTINEILVHLSQKQMVRNANEVVRAEELNVLVGSIPIDGAEEAHVKEAVKAAVLQYLYDTYGIAERDLITAEIEVVPAHHARDIGFDRSMVGGYGQDDRVCAYTALRALMAVEHPQRTCVCLLSDKEEIGSGGVSGVRSRVYENVFRRIMAGRNGHCDEFEYCRCIENSKMLSSDVAPGFEPSYPRAFDKNNIAYVGHGTCLMKYTGVRGKSGTNDACSEFFHEVAQVFDEHQILWQTGELGIVDLGGGGTIAVDMSEMGLQVIDCGVPLLSMHSPFEVTSKADIYGTYEGFKVFLKCL